MCSDLRNMQQRNISQNNGWSCTVMDFEEGMEVYYMQRDKQKYNNPGWRVYGVVKRISSKYVWVLFNGKRQPEPVEPRDLKPS